MSSKLKLKLNNNVTKGAFVEILKEIGDHQLFNQFYDSQRIRLKTKGLQGQILKMDMSKFHTLVKIKLSTHADWEKWLSKLLEVTQDYALVLPLWDFSGTLPTSISSWSTRFALPHGLELGWRQK